MCKILTPANRKNPFEPEKSNKFPKKTYTFDVTKSDEIFDLLVVDSQNFNAIRRKRAIVRTKNEKRLL